MAFTLTAKEYRILLLLAQGRTRKSIAREWDVTDRTVRRTTASMYKKLGAVNDAHAVAIAYRLRWIVA